MYAYVACIAKHSCKTLKVFAKHLSPTMCTAFTPRVKSGENLQKLAIDFAGHGIEFHQRLVQYNPLRNTNTLHKLAMMMVLQPCFSPMTCN